MLGMQNTPDRNSWRADQPSGEEYIIDMLYHDATGVITIELLEEEIRIAHCGSVPSTSYLMQESVIVQGYWMNFTNLLLMKASLKKIDCCSQNHANQLTWQGTHYHLVK
jgi:hypothetical protein